MRHVPFRIGEAERDAWLAHMRTALDELALPEALDGQFWDYLVMAAHSLVNQAPTSGPTVLPRGDTPPVDPPDRGGRGEIGVQPTF